ncbi:MAG: hypothetical protein EXR72_11270 [Myxococcales bacterium]|nr:hypothetical protein [Myxococcales bacterium]
MGDKASRGGVILLLLAASLLSSGCAGMLSRATTPMPPGHPRAAPWELTRELLLREESDRILIVVDWVQGAPADSAALDHLASVAARYGQRPASWVRAGEAGEAGTQRGIHEASMCPALMDPRTSYVFVRYVGDQLDHFGQAWTRRIYCAGRPRDVHFIDINQDVHHRLRFLWLTERHLEQQTLVHEYGHLLGLSSNPEHTFYAGYPSFAGGPHCVRPDCPVTLPSARSIVYGLYRTGLTFRYLDDYCERCRQDIEEARRFWRKQ